MTFGGAVLLLPGGWPLGLALVLEVSGISI
jgi:hypothetical protein